MASLLFRVWITLKGKMKRKDGEEDEDSDKEGYEDGNRDYEPGEAVSCREYAKFF